MSHPTSGSPAHSPGPPGGPRRRQPARTRWALVTAVSAGVVLLLVIAAGTLRIYRSAEPAAPTPTAVAPGSPSPSSPRPTPTASARTASATTRATAPVNPTTAAPSRPSRSSPTSSPSPTGPDRTLRRNALYAIDLDDRRVDCDLRVRSPRPPLKNDKLAPYLRDVMDCLVEVFAKPLAGAGIALKTPKVTSYAKTVKTPCGSYGQDKAPAFYCSATETIYWASTSDNGTEAYTYARLGYVALAAHEFGHHLQTSSGMTLEYGGDYYATKKKADRYLLSRRLELQAQCFEGIFLNQTAKSIGLSSADRAQLRTWHGYTGDEDPPKSRLPDHGTSAAQLRWLDRGIDSGDFGRCNTWTAPKKQVK